MDARSGSRTLAAHGLVQHRQAFFTEDPRIAVGSKAAGNPTGAVALPSPFERSHSEQLVLEKEISATDVRVTVGRTTTTDALGKIDPDNGTQQPLGPGALKFLTASVRHRFSSFGTLQAVLSKADARLSGGSVDAQQIAAQITPEAPRTIFDTLATLDRLPLGLHGRGEYEYVGHKQLDLATRGTRALTRPSRWARRGWPSCVRS